MRVLWVILALIFLAAAFAPPSLSLALERLPRPALLGAAAFSLLVWGIAHVKARRSRQRKPILIDGSNVLHWRNGEPDLVLVKQLVQTLAQAGYAPGVVFDANVGYKISDRFVNDTRLAKMLDLPVAQVMVSPKGVPADPFLLEAARDTGAAIVTNDRFRDWQEEFPDTANAARLIRGGFKDGALYLEP
ncbi:NYN domain-containing protein [Thalassobius sp. MITS945101]|uniref:NYN domain-containing protein n=1 Tax=Thalassobius sp. MITS945101 TaxID=3096994 RepID=UPI003999C250